MRRSAQRLKPATRSAAPPGNRASASPAGMAQRRAAARSAARDQPSNGTSGSIASINASRWAVGERAVHPGLVSFRPGPLEKSGEIDRVALQLFEEEHVARVGHPLRVQNAVEMIAFVLDDAGVKAFDLALDRLAVEADGAVADAQMARDDAAQPRHRQAAFPTEGALLPQRARPPG